MLNNSKNDQIRTHTPVLEQQHNTSSSNGTIANSWLGVWFLSFLEYIYSKHTNHNVLKSLGITDSSLFSFCHQLDTQWDEHRFWKKSKLNRNIRQAEGLNKLGRGMAWAWPSGGTVRVQPNCSWGSELKRRMSSKVNKFHFVWLRNKEIQMELWDN